MGNVMYCTHSPSSCQNLVVYFYPSCLVYKLTFRDSIHDIKTFRESIHDISFFFFLFFFLKNKLDPDFMFLRLLTTKKEEETKTKQVTVHISGNKHCSYSLKQVIVHNL